METTKSTIDLAKGEELKAIMDSEVFQEVLIDLKTDLMIQLSQASHRDFDTLQSYHNQIRAIDLIETRMQSMYSELIGEFE